MALQKNAHTTNPENSFCFDAFWTRKFINALLLTMVKSRKLVAAKKKKKKVYTNHCMKSCSVSCTSGRCVVVLHPLHYRTL